MKNEITQIYDKIFKRILTLSKKSVINLINGLFDTQHSVDSELVYNWTESISDELKQTIADTIITIDKIYSYHIEAQMYQDETIVLRVFDYGYRHAQKYMDKDVLYFPEPKIIYLYGTKNIADVLSFTLDFGSQGSFIYQVDTFKFLEHSIKELNDKKMIVLIPFYLLKFRQSIEKNRTKENMLALQHLVLDDIITVIDENVRVGNLTVGDAGKIRELIRQLYRHIYAHYEEFQGGMNDMVEEGLVLEMDLIEARQKKEIEEVRREVTQKVTAEVSKATEYKDIVNVYRKINDIEEVAHLLDVTVEKVRDALADYNLLS